MFFCTEENFLCRNQINVKKQVQDSLKACDSNGRKTKIRSKCNKLLHPQFASCAQAKRMKNAIDDCMLDMCTMKPADENAYVCNMINQMNSLCKTKVACSWECWECWARQSSMFSSVSVWKFTDFNQSCLLFFDIEPVFVRTVILLSVLSFCSIILLICIFFVFWVIDYLACVYQHKSIVNRSNLTNIFHIHFCVYRLCSSSSVTVLVLVKSILQDNWNVK